MDTIKSKIFSLSGFQKLSASFKSPRIQLKNIQGSFGAFVSEFVTKKTGAPLLYIANSLESAEKMHDDLAFITAHEKLAFLPGLFIEPYETSDPRPELVSMRLEAMQVFLEADRWIAACTYESLLEKLPQPETFVDNQVYTKVGLTLSFDDLISQLDNAGFSRVDIVEQVGEFSVRGGIIDIFAWNNEEPVRLEYFGNVIESIRTFDVITQRTTGNIDEFAIMPHLTEHNADVFLHDLLPQNTTLFFEDSDQFYEKVRRFYEQAVQSYEQDSTLKLTFDEPGKMYSTPEILQEKLQNFKQLNTNLVANDSFKTIDFKIRAHPDFNGAIKLFLEYLSKQVKANNSRQFIIQSHSVEQANRLQEIVEEEEIVRSGGHRDLQVAVGNRSFLPELQADLRPPKTP